MKAADQLQVAIKLIFAIRSQRWSAEHIRAHQDAALVRMMRHAALNVPFYQHLRLSADKIATAADLDRFPIIDKRQIQRDPDAFLCAGAAPAFLHASRTSGSSGQPTTTYFDRDTWLLTKYVLKMRRVLATAGVPIMRRVLIISEQPPERLDLVANAGPSGLGIIFSKRHLSIHSPIDLHLTEITRYEPHMIYAFPSYLLDLATTAQRRGVALPKIATLFTSSEVLTPAARRQIESAFRGRVYDVYGSTEFKEVAWQCAHGRYHLNFESVYVEVPQRSVGGAVVISTLCNVAMPLLRFDIGDRAVFGSNACLCGRNSQNMLEFVGREADMLTLPSGRRLTPYVLTTAIESEHSILQYRIVQTGAGAFRVEVITRRPGESAAWRERLCAELVTVLGEPVRFEVREVDVLERAPNGKRSVFIRAQPGEAAN